MQSVIYFLSSLFCFLNISPLLSLSLQFTVQLTTFVNALDCDYKFWGFNICFAFLWSLCSDQMEACVEFRHGKLALHKYVFLIAYQYLFFCAYFYLMCVTSYSLKGPKISSNSEQLLAPSNPWLRVMAPFRFAWLMLTKHGCWNIIDFSHGLQRQTKTLKGVQERAALKKNGPSKLHPPWWISIGI